MIERQTANEIFTVTVQCANEELKANIEKEIDAYLKTVPTGYILEKVIELGRGNAEI
jgi:hypothetical protein